MQNYKLHLIRHSFTDDDQQDILAGAGRDTHLSPAGRQHLAHMAATFAYPPVEALFVSPLMRAVETAELLYPGKRQVLIAPLVDVQFGPLEGQRQEALDAADFWAQWSDPETPVTPGGVEPYKGFCDRCCTAFATLLGGMMKAGIHEAAAITHEYAIAAILERHGLPQQPAALWQSDFGAGYTVRADVSMWMRSGLAEVSAIQPAGYWEAVQAGQGSEDAATGCFVPPDQT